MEPEPARNVAWYHRPFWIVVLALVALGPLALPLVWRSPAFSPTGRWVATALILGFTLVLVWQTVLVAELVTKQLRIP
jgi:hypothetical protein